MLKAVPAEGDRMETEISFINGNVETFSNDMDIKMTPYGVEVVSRDGDESVRVLFPWAQIEKVTQRGANLSAVYTY
jgi:hypothetical protein